MLCFQRGGGPSRSFLWALQLCECWLAALVRLLVAQLVRVGGVVEDAGWHQWLSEAAAPGQCPGCVLQPRPAPPPPSPLLSVPPASSQHTAPRPAQQGGQICDSHKPSLQPPGFIPWLHLSYGNELLQSSLGLSMKEKNMKSLSKYRDSPSPLCSAPCSSKQRKYLSEVIQEPGEQLELYWRLYFYHKM